MTERSRIARARGGGSINLAAEGAEGGPLIARGVSSRIVGSRRQDARRTRRERPGRRRRRRRRTHARTRTIGSEDRLAGGPNLRVDCARSSRPDHASPKRGYRVPRARNSRAGRDLRTDEERSACCACSPSPAIRRRTSDRTRARARACVCGALSRERGPPSIAVVGAAGTSLPFPRDRRNVIRDRNEKLRCPSHAR